MVRGKMNGDEALWQKPLAIFVIPRIEGAILAGSVSPGEVFPLGGHSP